MFKLVSVSLICSLDGAERVKTADWEFRCVCVSEREGERDGQNPDTFLITHNVKQENV